MKKLYQLFIIVCLLCYSSVACASHYYFVNNAQEAKAGMIFRKNIEAKFPVIYNTPESNLVDNIAYRLTAAIDSPRYDYQVKLIDDGHLNAYTGPAGNIYVTLQLEKYVKTNDELAFAIGHEMGHDMHEHWKQTIERKWKNELIAAAVGKAMGASNNQIGWLMTAAFVDVSRGYGFDKEKEADHFGFDVVTRAGFSPAAGALFFHNLMKLEENAPKSSLSTDIVNYINPHPKTINRLNAQLSYIKKLSNDKVEVKDNSIYMNGRFVVTPHGNANYDSYERAYIIAGHLAKLYSVNNTLQFSVDNNRVLANGEVIFTSFAGDESANVVLHRMLGR